MIKSVILIFFIALVNDCCAQDVDRNNIELGIDQFILGTHRSVYGATIKILEGGVAENTFIYHYEPPGKKPFELEGVLFSTLLTFDKKDRLYQVNFTKLYRKKISDKYKKEAKRDIKILLTYLRSGWNTHEGKKTYRKNKAVIDEEYEWSSANTVMKFRTSFNPHSQTVFVDLSFVFKNNGF